MNSIDNPIIQSLMNRRSIRAYADTPVEPEKRQAIIDAARRAPTAGNMQMYSILEITDQELKEKLAVSCDNQPFIAKAPLVLIFLADYHKSYQLFKASGAEEFCARKGLNFRKPGLSELFLGMNDALIAAQNSVVAAEALGLGSCYIGDIMEKWEYHQEILNLPDLVFPVTMLCYGYPKGAPVGSGRGITSRHNQEFVLFENHYRHFSDEEILPITNPLESRFKIQRRLLLRGQQPGTAHLCPQVCRRLLRGDAALHRGRPEGLEKRLAVKTHIRFWSKGEHPLGSSRPCGPSSPIPPLHRRKIKQGRPRAARNFSLPSPSWELRQHNHIPRSHANPSQELSSPRNSSICCIIPSSSSRTSRYLFRAVKILSLGSSPMEF